MAETVGRKEASRIAETFFNAAYGKVMAKPEMVYNGKNLTTDRLFSPFYVFNCPAGGFVIISAENKAYPVLGYSIKDKFNPHAIGKADKALLSEYARHIEFIRYDSRIPEEAIKAWTDLKTFIDGILKAPYEATELSISGEEASERVSNIFTTGRDAEVSSDIFSPVQWQDLINEELKKSHNVVIGLADKSGTTPVFINGRKGDFYRIGSDGAQGSGLMRLMATEFLSDGQFADIDGTSEETSENENTTPFILHEGFLEATRAEKEARLLMYEELLNPSYPVVRQIGGGHFEIRFPEEVSLGRIFSLQGAVVESLTFKNTDTAMLTLDHEPPGFYVALVYGESGKTYGIKLYK